MIYDGIHYLLRVEYFKFRSQFLFQVEPMRFSTQRNAIGTVRVFVNTWNSWMEGRKETDFGHCIEIASAVI